jgi:hypothetical protein
MLQAHKTHTHHNIANGILIWITFRSQRVRGKITRLCVCAREGVHI